MKYILFCFCVLMLSCKMSYDDIKQTQWKYSDGFHIDDVIDFRNEDRHRLSKDKKEIDYNNLIKLKLIKATPNNLIIENLKSGERGYYKKLE